jgi:hypothetical protein
MVTQGTQVAKVAGLLDDDRLVRRLELRMPRNLEGPATRAILQRTIADLAGRLGVPVNG